MPNIIIQGIQYDEKSSFLQGPALAPSNIREALHSGSSNYFTEQMVSIQEDRIIDKGDFGIATYFDIEKVTEQNLAKGEKILTLGGDHSITFPIIKALSKKYRKLDILHIDAHSDLYEEYEGDPYSHACPFARILEHKLAVNLVQVGIRTLNPQQAKQIERYQVEVHPMKYFDVKKIPPFRNPLYISLDMDAFDPAFAPGVSHHEPGGLTSRQVLDILARIDGKVVGADIVEYNPTRDVQEMTAYLAAKMMKELLGLMLK